MRRPCEGHEIGCLLLLFLKPNTGDPLDNYGREVNVLLEHFQNILKNAGLKAADNEEEWAGLKEQVFESYLMQNNVPSWEAVHQHLGLSTFKW